MLYGEKGYREKCYIGRNVTEGEMLQGETLQGELLQGELSWGETLYIPLVKCKPHSVEKCYHAITIFTGKSTFFPSNQRF